jgi:hypothetical protein
MFGTGRLRTTLTSIVLGAIALLALIPAADAGLSAPHGLHATRTAPGPALPFLAWSPVRGAEKYQVQVAADPSFKAPVLNSGFGDFTTSNTRATLKKVLPGHRYWWRVRAASREGAVSNWATGSFTHAWKTSIERDLSGGPFVMRWRPVAGALNYLVELSSDERFATLIGGRPITAAGTSAALPSTLPTNTYYWRVTPMDAEGNRGTTSPRRGGWKLSWAGPASTGSLHAQNAVTSGDLSSFPGASPQSLFLPKLSWKPSAGSVRYEVEINPDSDWAAGSRVCCSGTTVATTMTPTEALRSNRYYWRVRGLDANGNAGPWFPAGNGKDANAFTKTFDNVCSSELTENCITQSQPSLTGLRVEDAEGNGVGSGGSTSSPVIRWDPVPGASAYEYDIVPFRNGGCEWTAGGIFRLAGMTATTAWTPLGTPIAPKPYPDVRAVLATDGIRKLVEGMSYCARVRAQSDREQSGAPVYGDFTYLPSPAFRFAGNPQGAASNVSYRTPGDGTSVGDMPVFTWHPVAGARSYWVIVAKDPSFTNIIDYAFTQVPAYAPRGMLTPKTYPDETTKYYWVVLPASSESGACSGSQCIPQLQPHGSFLKAVPPTALRVTKDAAPTFDWNGVRGARRYDLEVSTDPHFGASFVDKVATVATSYTATKAYPPGKKLYWRVRAEDESLIGLTWALHKNQRGEPQPFTIGLSAPVGLRNEDRANTGVPTWRWNPVPGAASYDVHVELPDGTKRDLSTRVAAFTPTLITGTGIFHWRVRANFPSGFQLVPGPYSKELGFRRGITQPASPRTIGSGRALVLAWQPVLAAKNYSVQISSRRDFTMPAETVLTESPSYAPLLGGAFAQGGRFYWRVAAVDMYSNVGKFTEPRSFALPVPPKPKPKPFKPRPTPRATFVGVAR